MMYAGGEGGMALSCACSLRDSVPVINIYIPVFKLESSLNS